jgi:hypothetical protein
MSTIDISRYYREHSPITDPGQHAHVFDALPRDKKEMMRIIQGLIMHPASLEQFGQPSEPDNRGEGIRAVADTLEQLQCIDHRPLAHAREPSKRPRANCRNFAVLMVAMLRSQGVPARKRVGFAPYLGGPYGYCHIHEITEYWDEQRERWVMIDPDEPTIEPIKEYFKAMGQPGRARFDVPEIRDGESFHSGGLAWHLCRAGIADPSNFHVGNQGGMDGVRIGLLQDLDSLNKVELLSWDWWHELMDKPEAQLTHEEWAWLDQAADLTTHVDEQFDAMRQFYDASTYAQAVQSKLRELRLAAD